LDDTKAPPKTGRRKVFIDEASERFPTPEDCAATSSNSTSY
jgi:hypothetical protein